MEAITWEEAVEEIHTFALSEEEERLLSTHEASLRLGDFRFVLSEREGLTYTLTDGGGGRFLPVRSITLEEGEKKTRFHVYPIAMLGTIDVIRPDGGRLFIQKRNAFSFYRR